ncbi:MAG: ribosome silencing factor [Bacteroidetes bacterium]|nr:ribosome silencing factor [Bacteroidota bacterium]
MISRKARNVVILDLKKLTSAADYFVICSADSDTQVKAVADAVRKGMEESDEHVWHYEGYQALKWIVLDYVDVVAHIFYKEDRSFYNLERLWGDAKKTEVKDIPVLSTAKVIKKVPKKTRIPKKKKTEKE